MLKVKKKIPITKNKSEDVTQLHEEIKNYIKNLYLSNQKKKKKKTINEYAEILSKIRNMLKKIISSKLNHKNIKTMLKIYLRNHI